VVNGRLSAATKPGYVRVTPIPFGDTNEDGTVNPGRQTPHPPGGKTQLTCGSHLARNEKRERAPPLQRALPGSSRDGRQRLFFLHGAGVGDRHPIHYIKHTVCGYHFIHEIW